MDDLPLEKKDINININDIQNYDLNVNLDEVY
jgi:hypothetical protein